MTLAGGENSSCDEVTARIAEAIDGVLPARLEAHIDGCEACVSLLGEATRLGDRIRDAGDGYRHAEDFAARVVAALEPGEPGESEAPTVPRPRRLIVSL